MIDEKKLIEDVRKCDRYIAEVGEEKTLVDMVRLDDVKRTINAQPKTDWIPCEERLPSDDGKYLVTEMVRTALRKYYTVGSSYFNGETWHSDFKGKFGGKDIGRTVIAWQPLPQPYKKGGAE
jgi:hypothetical protein